jgi:hypothetical protein
LFDFTLFKIVIEFTHFEVVIEVTIIGRRRAINSSASSRNSFPVTATIAILGLQIVVLRVVVSINRLCCYIIVPSWLFATRARLASGAPSATRSPAATWFAFFGLCLLVNFLRYEIGIELSVL